MEFPGKEARGRFASTLLRAGLWVSCAAVMLLFAYLVGLWLDPAGLNQSAIVVIILTFVLIVLLFPMLLLANVLRGLERGRRRIKIRNFPKQLLWYLSLNSVIALIILLVSIIQNPKWSQDPPGTLARCKWSLVHNHPYTTLCVSHARYLATGQGLVRSAFAILILFLCAMASGFADLYFPRRESATNNRP